MGSLIFLLLFLSSCDIPFVHPHPVDYQYRIEIFIQDDLKQPINQAQFIVNGEFDFRGVTDVRGCAADGVPTGSSTNGKTFQITASARDYKTTTLNYIATESDYFIVNLEKETSSASSVVEKSTSETVQGKCSTM